METLLPRRIDIYLEFVVTQDALIIPLDTLSDLMGLRPYEDDEHPLYSYIQGLIRNDIKQNKLTLGALVIDPKTGMPLPAFFEALSDYQGKKFYHESHKLQFWKRYLEKLRKQFPPAPMNLYSPD